MSIVVEPILNHPMVTTTSPIKRNTEPNQPLHSILRFHHSQHCDMNSFSSSQMSSQNPHSPIPLESNPKPSQPPHNDPFNSTPTLPSQQKLNQNSSKSLNSQYIMAIEVEKILDKACMKSAEEDLIISDEEEEDLRRIDHTPRRGSLKDKIYIDAPDKMDRDIQGKKKAKRGLDLNEVANLEGDLHKLSDAQC